MKELLFNEEDLVTNPTPRVPVCLVLDTSKSMGFGTNPTAIHELNEGVKLFFKAIKNDEVAKYSAEVCIITFGGTVNKLLDFGSIEDQRLPTFYANGSTPIGEAVELALDLLEQRKREYSSAGVDYYQPWLVLMTDGGDGDGMDNIENAVARTCNMVHSRKLSLFPIGIGNRVNMDTLRRFSPLRDPLRLKGLNFCEFFEWLSKSISRVSQSTPGTNVQLGGVSSWATL